MKYIFLFLPLLLFGCASPQIIKVPVIQPWPEPPIIERPNLPISNTQLNTLDYGQFNKTIKISIKELMDYSEKLELIINSYRTKHVK